MRSEGLPQNGAGEINAQAEQLEDWVIGLRRDFHRHPELGGEEFQTSSRVAMELKKLGLEVRRHVGGYGVVGTLKGDKPGPTVALRADMDALPIQEKTGLPFASEVPGKMHACGHDAHTAILLGAAALLKEHQDEINGEVRFLFQPAEEGPGGAEPMIRDGCMENPEPEAIFALHTFPHLPAGTVGIRPGAAMAASDGFALELTGPGGHAAYPHRSVDLVSLSSHLVLAYNSAVSREFDTNNPVVLSIGSIHGGEKDNVMPSRLELKGTIRTLDEDTRKEVKQRMENLTRDFCKSWGAGYSLKYKLGYPSTYNNPQLSQFAAEHLGELLGEAKVKMLPKPGMGAEDFAFFAQKAPGLMFRLGTGFTDQPNFPNHTAEFQVNEAALKVGVASLSKLTLDYLGGAKRKKENR